MRRKCGNGFLPRGKKRRKRSLQAHSDHPFKMRCCRYIEHHPSLSSIDSFSPVVRAPFGVHHRHDPPTIWLIQVHEGEIWKPSSQCAPGWRTGAAARRLNQPLNLVVELATQFGPEFSVPLCSLRVLRGRFGMKDVRQRSPPRRFYGRGRKLLSPGTHLTLPDCISSMRRSISTFQSASISGLIACRSAARHPH